VPTTASSFLSFLEYAMPAAWRHCVAIGDEPVMMLRSRLPQCAGICRPPDEGSSFFPKRPRKTSLGVKPATSTSAMSR
jgi:hypothetical protein